MNKPKHDAKKRTALSEKSLRRVMIITVILLIAGLLASVGYGIYATYQNRNLTASYDQLSDQHQQTTQSADRVIQEQQSQIAGLESQTQSQQKEIASQKQQFSSLVSNYNQLVQDRKKANPTAAPQQYASSGVTEKTCYLTFDDGPSDNTLKILDILKQYNIKATFFVISSSKLSYVKRAHAEGHTIALHTSSHTYSKIYCSQKAYFDDLEQIKQDVQQHIDVDPKIIRFPGGTGNTVSTNYCKGIMTALAAETMNQGYVYFDWNVNSGDANANHVSVSEIMKNIRNQGGRKQQEVVLMHDTAAKTTTVEALPQIIEFYIEQGYSFAPITLDTPQVKATPRN